MVLVVLGGEPLDILEQWVKALFLAVPSGRGPRPVFDHLGRPYTVQDLLSSLAMMHPPDVALSPQARRWLNIKMHAHVVVCKRYYAL